MRAMSLEAPGPIAGRPLRLVRDGDEPEREREREREREPGEGEIAVAVRACAICRTDLQIVEGDIPMRRRPVVPGHQLVGVVDAIGPGARGWSIGDRVGVGWLASTCGECDACRSGRENLCARARFTGWDVDGGYATRAIVNGGFAFRIPEGFDEQKAAPLLCGGVIGYRALVRAGVSPDFHARSGRPQRVGLYGFGASAFLAMQIARHWGARIFVATRSRSEQERARGMGAAWAGGYDEAPPEPLDAAVTFAPVGSVVVAALRALDRGATVAVNAIHLDHVPAFSYDLLWWERNLVSVANYTRQDAARLLELAARVPLETRFETHPLEDANEVLSRLAAGTIRGSAVLTCS